MTRDWSKERWRKQHLREPLQQRLWPVMARGLRELLNQLAEDDGALVCDVDDPAEALVRALGPHEHEIDLVRGAIEILVAEGVLAMHQRSVYVRELPAAQAPFRAEGSRPSLDLTTPTPAKSAQTSTERVRRHRERLRERNGDPVSDRVPQPVSTIVSAVTSGVSFARDPGERNVSEEIDQNKYKKLDHPHPEKPRASASVSHHPRPVSSTVSLSVAAARGTDGNGEEDEGEQSNSRLSEEARCASDLPIRERASLVLEKAHLGRALRPEGWPEVQAIAAALAETTGLTNGYLGAFEDDPGVQAVLKLYAAGIPQSALEYVARTVPRQSWWSSEGKRLGLSSLSLEVVRRNLPGPDGRARVTNPGVAKALELLRSEREAANA